MEGLNHGPKFLSEKVLNRKGSKVALDTPQNFVAAALIGAEMDGRGILGMPSRRRDSQTPLQVRVLTLARSGEV